MKTTEDVRKYAAEQGIAEEEALKKGNGRKVPQVCRKKKQTLREGVMETAIVIHEGERQTLQKTVLQKRSDSA